MAKGKLIVLEGTDGAGKSTQLELIKQHLYKHKLTFDFLHFPKYGHNEFSKVIAAFLRGEYGKADEVNPYFVANIYAMDRFLFLPELNEMLEENDVVILDRYVFSGMAFQAGKYKNAEGAQRIIDWIDQFEFEFLDLPYPDLTLFLDVPMNVVKERLENQRDGADREYLQGKQDIHEQDLEFQSRVRDAYIKNLKDYEDYEIVPCMVNGVLLSPEDLFNSYKFYIDNIIDNG
jgi:dTMP kinase